MSRQFMPRAVQSPVTLAALLVILAGFCQGDPPSTAPPPPAERLAELEVILADTAQPADKRAAAAAEARRLRPDLIARASPDSLEAPVWALDQAAAELAAIGDDGADLAVLFGLPSEAQRQAVLRSASDARRYVREAEERIERLLTRAQAETTLREELDRGRAQTMRRLRDDEAGLRAPYYRGRAALLLAGVAREAGNEPEAAKRAREAIEAISLTEAVDPVAETARRITGAVAALFAGADAEAAAMLTRIVRPGAAPPGDDEIDAATHSEALFALATVRARSSAPQEGASWLLEQIDGPPFRRAVAGAEALQSDPLLIAFAHDAAARLLITADEPDPHAAIAIVMRLLERDDLGLSADQRRMLVAARVDHLAAIAGDAAGLAPHAAALLALHAAGDPDRRPEAIALLRLAASQTDDPDLRELARFEAAALLLAPPADSAQRAEGIDLLISMLQELDDWPRAAEAARAATAHAQAQFAADPDGAGRRDRLERALRAALGALPDHDAASNWRLDLARLLVSAPAEAGPRQRPRDDRYAEALSLLDRVDPTSAAGPPARELSEALHLEAIGAAREIDPKLGEAAARRALLWARTHRSPLEAHARLHLAETLLEQEAGSEAKAQLLAIADAADSLPGGSARVRLNLAKARLQTGGDAEAFADLVDLAQVLDSSPVGADPGARPEAFWEAWTLTLEILGRQNTDGRRDTVIRAHILRLRSVDSALGGSPWRDRIHGVEARLGP